MLVIRDDQFEAIGDAAVRRRGNRVYARLLDEFGEFRRDVFDYLFEVAIALAYQDEEQVYRFCRLAPFLGTADLDHPLLMHVSPELVSPLLEAGARLDFVENEMMPRLLGEGWVEPGPEPPSPTRDVEGARVNYDVYRSRMQVLFPKSDER